MQGDQADLFERATSFFENTDDVDECVRRVRYSKYFIEQSIYERSPLYFLMGFDLLDQQPDAAISLDEMRQELIEVYGEDPDLMETPYEGFSMGWTRSEPLEPWMEK